MLPPASSAASELPTDAPAQSVKARHYQHLAARLAALAATTDTARTTLEAAANQTLVMGDMATAQASMYASFSSSSLLFPLRSESQGLRPGSLGSWLTDGLTGCRTALSA